jgi:hypothetical protein
MVISGMINVGKTMPQTTHLGMGDTTFKNGDCGMVYYCFTHISGNP